MKQKRKIIKKSGISKQKNIQIGAQIKTSDECKMTPSHDTEDDEKSIIRFKEVSVNY
ncbi:hypothetical protein MOV73_005069 [Raoultella ornithinolytica]|uniref:hypothetical protein n=1 Tax=Klebsiella/Raoultella group TaxID=2890311 RepID=UPI001C10F75C|nr:MULTISPECIES: hypothetical protein [Klebsiella]EKT9524292.1 hypothetical protein [Raoultella ornithinolytica]EKW7118208.1 hypothetical protein [Raoultella ornithinolytica]ELS0867764.1 hypothetical protein [Raoultella ornithinolytica]MBU5394684.1 hypothetical protein [Klebsiella quasipneumoniae]MBV7685970.1 hypothetical protein [Klebsiella quasipneumoniae subsp. similipneumoniae]